MKGETRRSGPECCPEERGLNAGNKLLHLTELCPRPGVSRTTRPGYRHGNFSNLIGLVNSGDYRSRWAQKVAVLCAPSPQRACFMTPGARGLIERVFTIIKILGDMRSGRDTAIKLRPALISNLMRERRQFYDNPFGFKSRPSLNTRACLMACIRPVNNTEYCVIINDSNSRAQICLDVCNILTHSFLQLARNFLHNHCATGGVI